MTELLGTHIALSVLTTISLWCGSPSPTLAKAEVQACRASIRACMATIPAEEISKGPTALTECFVKEKLK